VSVQPYRKALTQDSRQTIVERIARDPEFARALFDEAATLFLNGEPDTARLILRDLVDATVGFEELAVETAKPAKSLHRMLSKTGNPTMDNVAAILAVVRKKLRVDIRAHSNRSVGAGFKPAPTGLPAGTRGPGCRGGF
jgi:DNA-binding phage protein